MSSAKQLLLPLYHVRKQTRRLSEKSLIILLLSTTVISLYLILHNLPSNVNIVENEGLNAVFVPRVDKDKQRAANNKVIHNEHDRHDFKPIERKRIDEVKQPIVEKVEKIEKIEKQPVGQPPQQAPPAKPDPRREETLKRREKVKEMTLLAWNGYKKFAWGKNELRPISKQSHTAGIFGGADNLGASLVDAMDTLFIMDLKDEVALATQWVKENFNIKINTILSAFEINIRFVGGFLAMYSLTNDKFFVEKAEEVARSYFSVFNTPTGIPYSLFNPTNDQVRNYNWAAGSCSILAELGTFSLEFQYLTDVTGKTEYIDKINKIYKTLESANKENGLYYNYINQNNGNWCNKQASIGGLADSFYEYLFKHWLLKGKDDPGLLTTYMSSIKAIQTHLLKTSSAKKLRFIGEFSNGQVANKMGHLACFSGGLFALTAMNNPEGVSEQDIRDLKELAADITHTCHESYDKTATKLGPEAFGFDGQDEPYPVDRYYILRPEVVESYFYMWRMTKDQKYRDWAWEMVEALEKHCKTEHGYSGLRDVTAGGSKDDVQQSFFFAETLKYLFLIFSDDDVLPLDKYVFNTEAHPFLIKKK